MTVKTSKPSSCRFCSNTYAMIVDFEDGKPAQIERRAAPPL